MAKAIVCSSQKNSTGHNIYLISLSMNAQSSTATFFQFEADFVESLRCIPMQVRFKLDTCGIKLKLPEWFQLSRSERQQLAEMPCETPAGIQAYRDFLCQLVQQRCGSTATDLAVDPTPDWMNETAIPASVAARAEAANVEVTATQWAMLSPLQRFALVKLSRSQHEHKNFPIALEEFKV